MRPFFANVEFWLKVNIWKVMVILIEFVPTGNRRFTRFDRIDDITGFSVVDILNSCQNEHNLMNRLKE